MHGCAELSPPPPPTVGPKTNTPCPFQAQYTGSPQTKLARTTRATPPPPLEPINQVLPDLPTALSSLVGQAAERRTNPSPPGQKKKNTTSTRPKSQKGCVIANGNPVREVQHFTHSTAVSMSPTPFVSHPTLPTTSLPLVYLADGYQHDPSENSAKNNGRRHASIPAGHPGLLHHGTTITAQHHLRTHARRTQRQHV